MRPRRRGGTLNVSELEFIIRPATFQLRYTRNAAGEHRSVWLKAKSSKGQEQVEQLGRLESEVMERLWHRGEASVREIHEDIGARLAYTTVMTTLDRLFKKGILKRRAVGRAFCYSPALTREEYNRQLTHHLLGIAVEESGSRQAVLSCFVDYVSESDRKLLDELDALIKVKKRSLRR